MTQDNEKAQERVYVVRSGDTLSKIAKEVYGDGRSWRKIFAANKDASNHPDELFALMRATNGLLHAAHPSLDGATTNWNFHDPAVQVSSEVFSRHGQYETHKSNSKTIRELLRYTRVL